MCRVDNILQEVSNGGGSRECKTAKGCGKGNFYGVLPYSTFIAVTPLP